MKKFIDLRNMTQNMSQKQKNTLVRICLLAVLVVLMAGAVWFNRSIDSDGSRHVAVMNSESSPSLSPAANAISTPDPAEQAAASKAPAKSPDYFENFRQDRARIREKELAMYDEIIGSNPGSNEAGEAATRKMDLAVRMNAEFAIEQVLRAKNFEDAVCIVRDNNVTVAVKKAQLSESDTATILSCVRNETNMHADNIKVIAVA